jgi:phage/plasmid-associated DNA primase
MNEKGRMIKNDIEEFFIIVFKVLLDFVNEAEKENIKNSEVLEKLKKTRTVIWGHKNNMSKNCNINNIFSLLLNKLSSIKTDIDFDIGTDNHYNIHFKNGVYNLKRGFRSRVETDYITKFLNYDYIIETDISQKIHNEVFDFFKKIQPNEEQRKFTLSYLAYCLTGDATKQIFKMNIGHTASNGKSTELSIHEKCFDIYTSKMDNRVLINNFEKRHKYLVDLIKNPIRLIYFEEMPKGKKLDVPFIKDFVDGKKISCEILFGTNEKFKIQAKIMSVSNHDFECDTDEGILRRGRVQFYESKFINESELVNEDQHIYKKVEGFENKFDDVLYKNAYFHLLLKYINELHVPKKNEDDFKKTAEESDEILNNILEHFILTKNKDDTISKNEIITRFGKEGFADYKAKLQSKGCKYDSQEYKMIDGKKVKGIFTSIQKLPIS